MISCELEAVVQGLLLKDEILSGDFVGSEGLETSDVLEILGENF